ncbi:hypothetical protein BJ165DRAFT_1404897 [Panaeolus papilionaceus]|nr:hypothetical protein BJ165DRAFT_1404897 [Panaeolus papilionaceus]
MLSKLFLLAILLVSTATNYAAAFILKIGDGGKEADRKIIEDAAVIGESKFYVTIFILLDIEASYRFMLFSTANNRLGKMLAALNGPMPGQNNVIMTAFGPQANILEIRNRVEKMINGRLLVQSPDIYPNVEMAATGASTKVLLFGRLFFIATEKERAGTIIHEASHALAETVDYFDQKGNPYALKTNVPGKLIVGYKDSNLDELIRLSPRNTFHNADSYRVFSDLV